MTSKLPDWISNVPLTTVGVLCATHIFGKNIESRQTLLAGKRNFHNAAENVVNYSLNPILPPLPAMSASLDGPRERALEVDVALQNIRDCFNYIFHIQVEYFKTLQKLMPERFKSKRTGVEFNLNQFSAKGPTLINSEKRYCILSKIDGAQPYDLDLNWGVEFDWLEESLEEVFRHNLYIAQDAYADTLRLGEWYAARDKNLIIPVKTIMDDLSEYFEHIGLAAYFMARNGRRRTDRNIGFIRSNLLDACRHLGRFGVDMMRLNAYSIAKHDLDKLDERILERLILVRACDDSNVSQYGYDGRKEEYRLMLEDLYKAINFAPAGA